MYLDFYALKHAPFHLTPDPHFLFLSPTHKAALGAMAYGINARQGFVAIFGAAGVGKTTLLRAYLAHVNPQELQTIFAFDAHLAFDDLLRLVARDLGLPATTTEPHLLMQDVQQALIEAYYEGRNVVLIIDEAQAMPVETLEHLRLLANLEVDSVRAMQIVLLGQPELQARLQQEALRSLDQSILIRSTITPLTRQESVEYVQHRLAKVAQDDQPIFTPRALNNLVRYAQGIPRVINALCTNALLAGFAAQRKPISAAIVRRVIAGLGGKRHMPMWQRGLVASTVLALVASLAWLAPWPTRYERRSQEASQPAPAVVTPPAQAPQTEAPIVSQPTPQVESPQAEQASVPLIHEQREREPTTAALPSKVPGEAEDAAEKLDTQAMQALMTRLRQKKKAAPEPPHGREAYKPLAPREPSERTTAAVESRPRIPRKPSLRPSQGAPGVSARARMTTPPPAEAELPGTEAYGWPRTDSGSNTE